MSFLPVNCMVQFLPLVLVGRLLLHLGVIDLKEPLLLIGNSFLPIMGSQVKTKGENKN